MKKNEITLVALEEKFANKLKYNYEIAVRKIELGIREVDENVGGGRSNIKSNPVEAQVIKELSDPYIANRILWKKSIDEVYRKQSDEVKTLLNLKYWDGEDSHMDWRSFGEKHGYSKTSIYRIRQKVLLQFGREIGEIN